MELVGPRKSAHNELISSIHEHEEEKAKLDRTEFRKGISFKKAFFS